MNERMQFIFDVEREGRPLTQLCRQYGVSRPTAYKWLRRYAEHGMVGLTDRSCAPRRHPNAVSADIEERIVKLREEHPHWGPRKLKVKLAEQAPNVPWPAASTMGDILKRHGLIVPRKRKRTTEPYTQPFAACTEPNHTWCIDFKGWFRTGDGRRCDPLTLTDAASRYLLRCHSVPRMDFEHTFAIVEAAFRQYGLPRAIRSDNGAPFASVGPGGLSRLSIWWIKLGIVPERIALGAPQQNGRHERFHLTLKQHTATPPRATLRAQQRAFNRFQDEYNHERPHEALGQHTPASCYAPSTRPYPARLPEIDYPPSMIVRTVEKRGQIWWRGQRIFIGEALRRERLGLEELDGRYYTVYFSTYELGVLDTHEYRLLRRTQAQKVRDKHGARMYQC